MNAAPALPDNQETLRNAISEADLLLAFAASHGIPIDDHTLETIVQSSQLLDSDIPENERNAKYIAFWKARSTLAQAVHPVSADSLKQCVLRHSPRSWLPLWLTRWFGGSATPSSGVENAIDQMQKRIVLPVLLLLLVQVYALIGAAVVGDLVPRMEKMHTYLNEQEKLLSTEKSEANTQAKSILERQIRLTQVEIEIRVNMLDQWNSGWSWISLPFRLTVPHPPDRAAVAAAADAADKDTRYHHFRAMVLQAEFALQVLQNFILPLLYGCLGASLYVLRALATDAKEYTFDMERRIGYHLRIYMGSLCGLVIGWFIPDAKVHEAGMTQYALSILGGYSVDILFGVMDKIILSLSSGGEAARKAGKVSDKAVGRQG
jgi:hypothetical protein